MSEHSNSNIGDCDGKPNSVINGDTPDTPPSKKKAIWYKQPFNEEWLQIEEFKEWLKPEPDRYASKCTVCDTKLVGVNKSALIKHAQTSKHEKITKQNKAQSTSRCLWLNLQSILFSVKLPKLYIVVGIESDSDSDID